MGRRILAPEVVQTSAMDCGPAALKCLLEGFGIAASYGRLREACQTDVDGTSIDSLEEVANQLGLEAEQVLVPVDHLLRRESDVLPALLVVRLASGFTHFVVVWRRHGPFVQIMDPASGRKWVRASRLLRDVYVHEMAVSGADWQAWASSGSFRGALVARLREIGTRRAGVLVDEAEESGRLAVLDAAVRLTGALVGAGGVRRGRDARALVGSLMSRPEAIAEACWTAKPREGDELTVRGAVLIHVRRRRGGAEVREASAELRAALGEAPVRPLGEVARLLRRDGVLGLGILAAASVVAAGSVILEALVLRGAIDIGGQLGVYAQRLEAVGCFLVFALALLLIELGMAGAFLRLGRQVEIRLRVGFLAAIPALADRYFRSRPISDMAERCHSIQQLRNLPRLGGDLLRAMLSLAFTAAAIVWVHPGGAGLALIAAVGAVVLPLAFKPHLEGLDLRVRTHTGALGRFYLDALLGLTAVRSLGAERSVRREHEDLLVEWVRASGQFLRSSALLEALQPIAGFALAFLLLHGYAAGVAEPVGALLLAYWALALPALGEEIATLLREYPTHRTLALRVQEPVRAPENGSKQADEGRATEETPDRQGGVSIGIQGVTVRAGGHEILGEVDLSIEPGRHVAIVGPSGAGKSSLVGLLLGWHRPSVGRMLVDSRPLDEAMLEQLRKQTVWVDPSVQLWNRSLLDNLSYGNAGEGRPISQVLGEADLTGVLGSLPDGLQTSVGEGGGLLSGGEGQRVRFARGLLRPGVRLVILDEPFRGLGREQRQKLLERARRVWSDATLLCITHDIGDAVSFDDVVVIEDGQVAERGDPSELAAREGSRFRQLFDLDELTRKEAWSARRWRRMDLREGRLHEEPAR